MRSRICRVNHACAAVQAGMNWTVQDQIDPHAGKQLFEEQLQLHVVIERLAAGFEDNDDIQVARRHDERSQSASSRAFAISFISATNSVWAAAKALAAGCTLA